LPFSVVPSVGLLPAEEDEDEEEEEEEEEEEALHSIDTFNPWGGGAKALM
jgi:hypothetical protein